MRFISRLAAFVMCVAVSSIADTAAQTTQKKETVPAGLPSSKMAQLRGEVVAVGPNWLVARMDPGNNYRLFDVKPGAMATIDGVKKSLSQLRLGTMLTSIVTTTETPLTKRTTTITKGRLVWASPTSIVATLENGENRQYTVPPGFKFTVEGKQLGAEELRPGMVLTGTNVVEEPLTQITRTNRRDRNRAEEVALLLHRFGT